MSIQNNLLFSEFFFNQIRNDTRDLENLRANLETIRQTWGYYRNELKTNDRDDIRAKVVQPILGYVGLSYAWNEEAGCLLLYSDYSQTDVVGVCLIRAMDERLECTEKGMNFAQQTVRTMRQQQVCWGILTNGSRWRLYRLGGPAPIETFLEADLGTIVSENSMPDYIVFQRFFSGPSFARTSGNQLTLDTYQEQSEKGTAYIEQHLQEKVEEIIKQVCLGFIEQMPNEKWTEEKLKHVYDNAMYLLYRLLFVLYAEARRLLPLNIGHYQNLSLKRLLEDALRNHKDGFSTTDDFELWKRLRQLFGLIDIGDTAEGILPYNGGLFRSGRWDLLDNGRIRNAFLNSVLLDLAFMPGANSQGDQTAIDYRDLSVRHLGSLYEGLLESKLFLVEDEPVVVRQDRKKLLYVPLSTAGNVKRSETVLEVGKAYLAENKHERKATGSYYTPEHVVQHIVDQTVQPKLEELRSILLDQIAADLQSLKFAANESEAARIRRLIDDKCVSFVERKVLALKILDIAMGSGHFLTNAMLAVSEFIVDMLNATPWHNPEIETDIVYWKRRVAENCVFGVDLNLLAVELAKLSLWITTADLNKPLTFLDHHLRHGNSLIGTRLSELGKYPSSRKQSNPGQEFDLKQFDVALAGVLRKYRDLRGLDSDIRDNVKEKETIYSEIREAMSPYRDIADLHTAAFLGYGIGESAYAKLGTAVQYGNEWAEELRKSGLASAIERARQRHFFHWEIEFPELFWSTNSLEKDGGADIVLGNPPYIRVQLMPAEDVEYYNWRFESALGSYDIYILFIEQGLQLLRRDGHLGFINPHKFITTAYGKKLCLLLGRNYFVRKIVHFQGQQVFDNATTYVCLLFVDKTPADGRSTSLVEVPRLPIDLDGIPERPISNSNINRESWILVDDSPASIMSKMSDHAIAIALGAITRPHRCLFTGLNQAFVVDKNYAIQNAIEKPVLKPILRGQDVKKWRVEYEDLFIIYPYQEIESQGTARTVAVDLSLYPNAKRHLEKSRDELVNRIEFSKHIRDPQERERRFFEFNDPRSPSQFEQAKIMVPDIQNHNAFVYDEAGFYALNVVYVLNLLEGTDGHFLTGILNSRLLEFFYKNIATAVRGGYYRYTTQYLEQLPIPLVSSSTPESERAGAAAQLIRAFEDFLMSADRESFNIAFDASLSLETTPKDVLRDFISYLASKISQWSKECVAVRKELLDDMANLGNREQLQALRMSLDNGVDEIARTAVRRGSVPPPQVGRLTQLIEEAKSKVTPRSTQIAKAEFVLNQSTYKMFGITREEIEVIDGSLG